jgi:hypothetical protein
MPTAHMCRLRVVALDRRVERSTMSLGVYRPVARVGKGAYWLGLVLGLGVLVWGVAGVVSYFNGHDLARTGQRVSAVVARSDRYSVDLQIPQGRSARSVTIRREGPSLCDYNYVSSSRATLRCDPIRVSKGDHIDVFVDRHNSAAVRPVDAVKALEVWTPVFITAIGFAIVGMCVVALRRLGLGQRNV